MSPARTDALAIALADPRADAADVLTHAGCDSAAAAVRGGQPLAEALARHQVLPPALAAAFTRGAPHAVRPLVEAGLRLRQRAARVRRVVRAAVVSAALALTVMIASAVFVLPEYLSQFMACGVELPVTVKLGLAVFGGLSQPPAFTLCAVALGAVWMGTEWLWLRSPAGRAAEATLVAESVATLVSAGIELPEALRQVSRGIRSGRALDAAARAIEGGAPAGATLARAGLIDAGHARLVDLPGQDALPAVLGAMAAVRRAEQSARDPNAGRGFWMGYTLAVGLLAMIFAAMIIVGSVLVLECLG